MTSRPPFLRAAARQVSLSLLLAFGLSACITGGGVKESGNYAELASSAEAEIAAGRVESALVAFDQAAQADPTRKEPWVRIAQLQFDAGNYGRAIVAAEEVLQRDPTDKVADSVLTVAGLRIAAQSLQRLQASGALASDTARVEAERLAATMRATMGEEILESGDDRSRSRRPARRTVRRDPAPKKEEPAKQESTGNPGNPFQLLGGG